MGEHIYRFGVEELKVVRLKFANGTVREVPLQIAASYDEAITPDQEKHLANLALAIQFFSRRDNDVGVEFVLDVRPN